MVYVKHFRFCWITFVFAFISFQAFSEQLKFETFLSIAENANTNFRIVSSEHYIDSLNYSSFLTRWFPSFMTSLKVLSNHDTQSKSSIQNYNVMSSFSQLLPFGINLSVSSENNISAIKLTSNDYRYRFSGGIDFSVPFYLASPDLLKHYTDYDIKAYKMYTSYNNLKLAMAKNQLAFSLTENVGMFLLYKEYADVQTKTIEIMLEELKHDIVLLEQGKISFDEMNERETKMYNAELQLITLNASLKQFEQQVNALGVLELVKKLSLTQWLCLVEKYAEKMVRTIEYEYDLRNIETSISTYNSLSNQLLTLPRINLSFNIEPISFSKTATAFADSIYDYWAKTTDYNFSFGVSVNFPFSFSDGTMNLKRITNETMKLHELKSKEIYDNYVNEKERFEISTQILKETIALHDRMILEYENKLNLASSQLKLGLLSEIEYRKVQLKFEETKLTRFSAQLTYLCKLLSK